MKLVKEHINEKFTEDSDPIQDMGIGSYFTKIQTLFNRYYSKYGKLDFIHNKNYTKIIIFIPYSKWNILQNIKLGNESIDDIILDLESVTLSHNRKPLDAFAYKTNSFNNNEKFHFDDKGIIFKFLNVIKKH